ncbi:hypothetical protein PsYK624_067290 [Phanerochaete sordida]|uniref:Uncharacterized protein n=1 Tax=Phanerochaete sordida TaxID=48140 RepID=A0A9P3GAZ7_9APHY|nr:hypothetical protein PsYK624_067290 [Phanerochaete sordida]
MAMENPKNVAFTALEYPLSALYLNVVLANLNARSFLRSSGSGEIPGVYDTSSADLEQRAVRMVPLQSVKRGTSTETADNAVKVHIDRSVTLKSDTDSIAGQKAVTLP